MCPFCPHVCSMFAREFGPSNPGLVKNGPSGARCGGTRPGAAPSRTARRRPGLLDQWSRPFTRAPGARPESPIPMPSHSVRPAGNRHPYGGYVAGADAPDRPGDARDSGKVLPGGGADCRRRSKRQVRWGILGDGGSVRRILTCPAGWGEDGHSRAGCPGTTGCRHRERSRPHGGCVRLGRPTAGHRWQQATGVTLVRSVRGHRFRATACCCRRQQRDGPG